MPDYSKGKVYSIVINGKKYIGSTCRQLCQRKGEHIYRSKSDSNRKLYKYVAENGGWDNVKIVLLENYPCKSKEELFAREDYYITKDKPELNDQIAILTEEHKQERNEKAKVKMRKAREEDPEKYLKRGREYYDKHKQELNKREREKTIHCDACNYDIRAKNIQRHNKSELHIFNSKPVDEKEAILIAKAEQEQKLELERKAKRLQKVKEYQEKNKEKVKQWKLNYYENKKVQKADQPVEAKQ